MSGLEALVLGLVQGLTEFLPVSSSGHLVVFQTLFGIEGEGGLAFEVAVHLGTLAAILIVYRSRVGELLIGAARREPEALRYTAKLGLATLPAIVVALSLADWIEHVFASPEVAGACLLVTAGILWTTRTTLPRATGDEPSWGAALAIGCAQAFAILPGISRSGSTVAVALWLGVAPAAAAEFSFLMGTIAMGGAAILILPGMHSQSLELLPVVIGSVASLAAGILAIALFLRLLNRRNFYVFSFYLLAAGTGFLAYLELRA